MKVEEIRALKPEELPAKLEEAYQEVFNLSLRLSTRQLRNHRQLRAAKRDVARFQTVIKERELGIS